MGTILVQYDDDLKATDASEEFHTRNRAPTLKEMESVLWDSLEESVACIFPQQYSPPPFYLHVGLELIFFFCLFSDK